GPVPALRPTAQDFAKARQKSPSPRRPGPKVDAEELRPDRPATSRRRWVRPSATAPTRRRSFYSKRLSHVSLITRPSIAQGSSANPPAHARSLPHPRRTAQPSPARLAQTFALR